MVTPKIEEWADPAKGQAAADGPPTVDFQLRFPELWTMSPIRFSPFLLVVTAALSPALAPAVHAQTGGGAIEGRVVADDTGEPVPVVRIEAVDPEGRIIASSSTDGEGNFRLGDLPGGPVELSAERIGYAPFSRQERVVEEETLVLTIRLAPEVLTLAPFEVGARAVARRPELEGFSERAGRGVGGVLITRDEIEARSPGRITDLLRGVPEVRVIETPSVGQPNRLVALAWSLPGRGGGGCNIQIFLNGVPAPDPGPLSGVGGMSSIDGTPIDHLADPDDLQGVEVYTDLASVPPEFMTPRAGCGVIALWTRTRA